MFELPEGDYIVDDIVFFISIYEDGFRAGDNLPNDISFHIKSTEYNLLNTNYPFFHLHCLQQKIMNLRNSFLNIFNMKY